VRVALLDTHAPFAAGGVRPPAARLAEALRERGHEAVVVRLPFAPAPHSRVVDQMLAMRLIHLDGVDRAIGLRFPAHLVPHEETVLWLLDDGASALRGAEPNGGAAGPGRGGTEEPAAERAHGVGRSVLAAERRAAAAARRVYAPSAADSVRLERRLGVEVAPLLAPPRNPGRFRCEGYGGRFVAYATHCSPARRASALAAFARSPASRRGLALLAPADAASQIAALALQDRVQLVAPAIGEAGRGRLLASAPAVLDLDGDPDGRATIEAFHAAKGVIALDGADGAAPPATLLREGASGRIARSPEGFAAALDELADDRALAERYGAAAAATLQRAGVDWDRVAAELTR
jgi:hypothetical protein